MTAAGLGDQLQQPLTAQQQGSGREGDGTAGIDDMEESDTEMGDGTPNRQLDSTAKRGAGGGKLKEKKQRSKGIAKGSSGKEQAIDLRDSKTGTR